MDGNIADIITQFAEYLKVLVQYLREFIENFTKKKDEAAE